MRVCERKTGVLSQIPEIAEEGDAIPPLTRSFERSCSAGSRSRIEGTSVEDCRFYNLSECFLAYNSFLKVW
jgi:hypothetical protein